MATPEQNALLAMQLFSPVREVAGNFAQAQRDKGNVMLKLAQMQREEQLRRDQMAAEAKLRTDLATQGYAKAIELEGMRGDREDERSRAYQTKADSIAKEQEARQLRALMSKTYHEYALEAEEAGIEIKPREDFTNDDTGLGELTKAYAQAKKANKRTEQKGIAKLAGAELTNAADEFKQAQTQLQLLSQPNEEDNKQASLIALGAVEKAIQSAVKPPPPKAVEDGKAALKRGDLPEAKKLLGADIFDAYESGFQQALRGLLNTPARRQQITEASRAAQGIQARLRDMTHSYRVGAAQNPELAAEVTRVVTPLERMMTEMAKAPPTFDANPKLNQGASPGSETPAPGGKASATPAPTGMYPATSLLGALQRAPAAQDVVAFPGRAVDLGGRLLGAGVRGVVTGDYTLPEKGLIQQAGEGIGGLISGDPYANTPVVAPIDIEAVLAVRPNGPFSQQEIQALQARNAKKGPGLLQTVFPGAR